ncbi:hypothetical protein ACGFNU_43115 [Spirillospora sp. NPDC048911]|uniref:hypothetical protein n=1 Tax=Spirillospora sp. NPDC048911 TaxID=3364527 RepID=UPI0037218117
MADDMTAVPYALLAARVHALLRLAIEALESYLYLVPVLDEGVPRPLLARAADVARERAERREHRLARFEDLARTLALTPVIERIRTLDAAVTSAFDAVHATDDAHTRLLHEAQEFAPLPPPSKESVGAAWTPAPSAEAGTEVDLDYERMLRVSEEVGRLAEESYEKVDLHQVDQLGRTASRELDRVLDGLDDLPILERRLGEARERVSVIESELAALHELAAGIALSVARVRPADQMLVRGEDVYDVVFGTALENALAAGLEALRAEGPEAPRDWDAFADTFNRSLAKGTQAEPPIPTAPVDLADLRDTLHGLAPSMDRRVRAWFLKVGDRLMAGLGHDDGSAATITLAALCLAAEAAPHSPEAAAELRRLAAGH